MTKTEKLLRELIALPSVNPAFLPPQDPRAGEQRVADFLAAVAARGGLEIEFQPVLDGRANLLARLTPEGPVRKRVLLAPHLDTVVADDGLLTPRRAGGRIYGRGACDTKGSVAAMLSALCEVARSGRRPAQTEILFAGLVDEENFQAGSRALAARGVNADFAIVGEPTELQVVTAHKGSLWIKLETRGKAAHGSRPELGRNAIHEMARVVELLETRYAASLRRRRHPLLGSPTVSVGVFSGGTQPNIVPDRATIVVDRRTVPGETEAGVRRELAGWLRQAKLKAVMDTAKPVPCRPLETDPCLPWVRQLLESAGRRRSVGADYFCDAAILAAGGTPSVVFGPGSVAQAHTADEWLALDALERATAILTRFLRGLP